MTGDDRIDPDNVKIHAERLSPKSIDVAQINRVANKIIALFRRLNVNKDIAQSAMCAVVVAGIEMLPMSYASKLNAVDVIAATMKRQISENHEARKKAN